MSATEAGKMSMPLKPELEKQIRTLRKNHALHGVVESRLHDLLLRARPNGVSAPEVGGVLGGRNDLINFDFSGRRIVFEVFCSHRQVPQDLRLLELSNAEVKVAVLLDEQVDPMVANQFFHKKPDAFPFLWVSEILRPDLERLTIARLLEITDEASPVRRIRKLMTGPAAAIAEPLVARLLDEIEKRLPSTATHGAPKSMSGKEVLARLILMQVMRLPIKADHLRSLYAWLLMAVEHAVEQVVLGFPAFLLTDLGDLRAFWTAGDVADWYLFGGGKPRPVVLVEVTGIIQRFLKAARISTRRPGFHFVHGYAEFTDLVPKWEGSKTRTDPAHKRRRSQGTGRPSRTRAVAP